MTEHEYNQTEKRRTEGTAGRRYQQGGRDSRQWDRQGGQTSWRTGEQTGRETGSQMGQQSSFGTSGQSSYGTGGRSGGGQSSFGTGSRTSQQTGGQMGGGPTSGSQMGQSSGGTGGQPSGRMGGGPTGGGQTSSPPSGGEMGRSSGSFGGQSQQTGQMGGQQTSQMGGQSTTRTGSQQVGQMGGQSARQSPIKPVAVRDIAATDVVTVRPDEPLTEVVQKMRREDVGSVVVTEGNRPVGIVTDRKVALALGETQDVSQLRASDLMSENLVTVPEGTNVFDLVRRLSDKGVRRVPVVGDQGDLTGIVSLDDVFVLLAEEFYNVSQIIRKQSPRF